MKRRWTLHLAILLSALFGLCAGLLVWLHIWATHQLEEQIQQVHAQQESLQMEDLLPPPLSDEQNGVCFYNQAEKYRIAAEGEEIRVRYEMRGEPMKATPEEMAILEGWLEKNKGGLDLLDQGLAMTDFRSTTDYSNIPDAKFPNLLYWRHAIELYIARAMLAVRQDKEEEAFAACTQAIRLARTQYTDPTLISHMIYMACQHMSVDCLKVVLERFTPSGAQTNALIAELEMAAPYERYVWAMEGERCFGSAIFDAMLKGRKLGDPLDLAGLGFFQEESKLVLRLKHARYLEEMAFLLDLLRSPLEALKGEWREAFKKLRSKRSWLMGADDSFLSPLGVTPNIELTVALSAHITLARLSLMLVKHWEEKQCLPEYLEDLFIESEHIMPLDPFSGQPFLYEKRWDGGFLLYSVGMNRQDDGGKPGAHAQSREGDMLWSWSP